MSKVDIGNICQESPQYKKNPTSEGVHFVKSLNDGKSIVIGGVLKTNKLIFNLGTILFVPSIENPFRKGDSFRITCCEDCCGDGLGNVEIKFMFSLAPLLKKGCAITVCEGHRKSFFLDEKHKNPTRLFGN